jgi:hypothetical protein
MKDKVSIGEINGQQRLVASKKAKKQLEKSDKLKQLCIIRREKVLKCQCPTVKLKRSSRKDPTCQSLDSRQQLTFWELTRMKRLRKKW